jgi:PhnB protein
MPTARLCPYIAFQGNAREAMTFYQQVLGGELSITNFGDIDMPGTPEDLKGKVMHSMLDNDTLTFMASDTAPGMPNTPGTNITMALSGTDAAKLRKFWDGLSAGGQITAPLEKQAWGDEYGSLTDRFGINWMVNIGTEQ